LIGAVYMVACVWLCTLLFFFIQLVLTLQVYVWQKLMIKCQSFSEYMHTSMQMNKCI